MFRWAIHGAALALTLAAVEGCGQSGNSVAPDASPGVDGSVDAEGLVEAGAEAGPDCGAAAPTGTQIVASTDPLVVLTMMSDGYAVYENLSTQELYAVAVTGGTPSDIGKMKSQGATVWTRGDALLWLPTEANPMTNTAPLSSWTASQGTSAILDVGSRPRFVLLHV